MVKIENVMKCTILKLFRSVIDLLMHKTGLNKAVRGQGLGVQWLAQLCAIADNKYPGHSLQLYVLAGNPAAKTVYLKNGFETLPESENIKVQFADKEFEIIKMELIPSAFSAFC